MIYKLNTVFTIQMHYLLSKTETTLDKIIDAFRVVLSLNTTQKKRKIHGTERMERIE